MIEDRCWRCHVLFSRILHHEGEICPSCGAPPDHAPAPAGPERYHPLTGHYHPEEASCPKGE